MTTKICPACGQEVKSEFDWSLMPIDTIVEIKHNVDGSYLAYYSGVNSDNEPTFFGSGKTSVTVEQAQGLSALRRIRATGTYKIVGFHNNPIRPWFGGECPVHPDVLVKIYQRDSTGVIISTERQAKNIWWGCPETLAYQIVDQEIP